MRAKEFVNGQWTTVDNNYRAYGTPAESSADFVRFLSTPRYANARGAKDFDSAVNAIGKSGYATDPAYSDKLRQFVPKTKAQEDFISARQQEILTAGGTPVQAELGARMSALETGWGKSTIGSSNNYYGIKDFRKPQIQAPDVRMAGGDPSQMTPGDPRSGRMNLPPFPSPQQAPQDSFADTLKPLIGLLAGYAGGRGSTQERIGGAGLASGAMQVAENELLDLKQKRADAQRRRQGQDSLDRYAAILSANPETADIGAAMMVDPGAGMQMYAQRQQAQQAQVQREAHAQQLKAAGATDYQVAQAMAGQNPGRQNQPAGPAEYGLQAQPYYKTGANGEQEPWERVYSKDGTFIDRKLPGPLAKFDPAVAGALATGKGFGEGEAKALPILSQSFTDISVAHDETSRLLTDFETGKYAGDTGPLIGRLKQLWDPDVATLRASATGQQLQNLQIVNLAPVTERELALIGTLGPNPDYTNPQNIAVLKRLVDIQATKKALLKKAMARINKEGYEAYIRNPVTVEDVKAAPPVAGAGGTPTAPATGGGWSIRKKE